MHTAYVSHRARTLAKHHGVVILPGQFSLLCEIATLVAMLVWGNKFGHIADYWWVASGAALYMEQRKLTAGKPMFFVRIPWYNS